MLPADSPLRWWDGFPVAFALTCVIELPAYLLAFASLGWLDRRRDPRRQLTWPAAVGLALAVNLITHPVLWALSHRLRAVGSLILAEVGVAGVEGMLIFLVAVGLGAPDRRHGLLRLIARSARGRSRSTPPTSSSTADEKRVRSLLLSSAARDLGWALLTAVGVNALSLAAGLLVMPWLLRG